MAQRRGGGGAGQLYLPLIQDQDKLVPLVVPAIELRPQGRRVLAAPDPHVPAVREDRVLRARQVEGKVALAGHVDGVPQNPKRGLLLLLVRRGVPGRDVRVPPEVESPLLLALGRGVVDDGGRAHGHRARRAHALVPLLQDLLALAEDVVHLLQRVVVLEGRVEAIEALDRGGWVGHA